MKLVALAVIVGALAPNVDIRFEPDGLRVDGVLVKGAAVELKGSGAALLLASGDSVEALASNLDLPLAPDRTLVLEPGLRVVRTDGGFRFTAHGPGAIRFSTATATIAVAGPALVSATADGWRIGDRAMAGPRLQAGVPGPDDAGTRINKVQGVPKLSTRTRRLYWGNPLTNGNASESVAVRQIGRVTPDGAP